MEMWCHQCSFFLGKIIEIILYVHGGPQGCIVCDDDYERVFFKNVPTSFEISNETTLIANEEDEYYFAASDNLIKLPSPDCEGSLRKSVNLKFYFDFRK